MEFFFPKKIIDENLSEWIKFENPFETHIIYKNSKNMIEEIHQFFETLQKNQRYYFSGFFSYNFGEVINKIPKLSNQKKIFELPLVYGGFYSNFTTLTIDLKNIEYESYLKDFKLLQPFRKYKHKLLQIKKLIRNGNVYQVNYTFPVELSIYGNIQNLFFHLWKNQKSLNSALVLDKNFFVLSISPELFFEVKNLEIKLKPMKGTISKSMSLRENITNLKHLKSSAKEKAENAMIVDLIRNDVGKISKIGSVKLAEVYHLEMYPTIIQMVSIINSKLKVNSREMDFWNAIFPSGSVTGAPKLSAMKYINRLENFSREIYTGSIGYITPENYAKFNVAIRSIFGNFSKSYYFVGSGITIDSYPLNEYKECLLKFKFIKKTQQSLKPEYIFTTMKICGSIIFFKKSHIIRLIETKKFFSYQISEAKINKKINRLETLLKNSKKPIRVHFRIYSSGKVQVFLSYINKQKQIKFMISSKRVNANNIFLYYKTNHRNLYSQEFEKAKRFGYDEVIFLNEKNYITEGSFTNIIIKLRENYYTPKLQNGLLKGIFLNKLIKKLKIKEMDITLENLIHCDQIYFVNSVRGIMVGELSSIFLHP